MFALPALLVLLVPGVSRAETWTLTAPMNEPRVGHTATALADGRVLVCGGDNGGTPSVAVTCELFDPTSSTFKGGPVMLAPRARHTATLLADGRVLVVGGRAADGTETSQATAEIFDPKTATFRAVASMTAKRLDHAAVLLPSGRVLVSGGDDGTAYLSTAEVYDPAADRWALVGGMAVERVAHTAHVVGGAAMIVGGSNGDALSSVELFAPATSIFGAGPALAIAHSEHVAVALDATHLLVVGGNRDVSTPTNAAELFDATTAKWLQLPPASDARLGGQGLLLANGAALVACGRNAGGPIGSAELFDPRTRAWSSAGTLAIQRERCALAPLPGGRVLVMGGMSGLDFQSTAEIYAPAPQAAACASSGACASGACVDGVCCDRPCGGACERCDDGARKGTCSAVSGAKNHCATAGQVCIDGACKAGTGARCTDDGLGYEDTSGATTSCGAFRCRPSDGACYPSCTDSTQCAPAFACDGARCTNGGESSADGGCLVGRGASRLGGLGLASLAAACVALARRRRRG